MIIAVTGHRLYKLGGYGRDVYARLAQFAKDAIARYDPEQVISGMAMGWDMAVVPRGARDLARKIILYHVPGALTEEEKEEVRRAKREGESQIEVLPPDSELPDWEDLRGCAPDATGALSSEAFVRKLREEWR